MSSPAPAESPVIVNAMKVVISGDLNPTLLLLFLTGAYVMVYFYTTYLYETQKENKNRYIVVALSALCSITVAMAGLQWQSVNLEFVEHSATRLSIVTFSIFGDAVLDLSITTLENAAYILADGLLLWRCYCMLGRSKVLIYFPLFMYACEIALCVVSLALYGVQHFHTAEAQRALVVPVLAVTGTLNGVTAITSTSATLIICRKISASVKELLPMKRRYKHIIRILIESSALYSLSGIFITIANILGSVPSAPMSNILRVAQGMTAYVTILNMVATGLAPTLMVAQICLSSRAMSTETEQTRHISALEFDHPDTVEDASRGSQSSMVLDVNSKEERQHV